MTVETGGNGSRGGTSLVAAIVGGLVGAGAVVGLLLGAPQLVGTKLVRSALMAHPEMLIEVGDSLRDRQYAPTLAAWRSRIETPFYSSWEGATKPDVTLTYFYDYACGYCRRSNPDIARLLSEDKGLRVVYRELPILGPNSLAAAKVSLAAAKAGRFAAFHDALFGTDSPSEANIAAAAAKVGVSPAADSITPDEDAELRQNFEFARAVSATGTPLFVVGNRVINAAVGYDGLKAAIAAARKG
ncbi:DsbA family protein [Sphingomonas sp. ASV193]|uniref:DsbA family protein n=1 Tax=Sphingomonas sp. ASV193 TaxID=3144405 RepID=UPI0032E87A9F